MQGIVQSFHAVESELRSSINNQERRTSQLSTLKELSDLCYVTFDSDDLFAITLERALKLTNADIGSVMILEGKEREVFMVHATYGLGELVKKGDRVDFATSIAKFAVINKSPILIERYRAGQPLRTGEPLPLRNQGLPLHAAQGDPRCLRGPHPLPQGVGHPRLPRRMSMS